MQNLKAKEFKFSKSHVLPPSNASLTSLARCFIC